MFQQLFFAIVFAPGPVQQEDHYVWQRGLLLYLQERQPTKSRLPKHPFRFQTVLQFLQKLHLHYIQPPIVRNLHEPLDEQYR